MKIVQFRVIVVANQRFQNCGSHGKTQEHYVTYFKLTGKTLKEVSAEYHEAVHHTHKTHERTRGFYQKKGLGGASHEKRSQAGIVQFNTLHAGFLKKSDLQLRRPSKGKLHHVDICTI